MSFHVFLRGIPVGKPGHFTGSIKSQNGDVLGVFWEELHQSLIIPINDPMIVLLHFFEGKKATDRRHSVNIGDIDCFLLRKIFLPLFLKLLKRIPIFSITPNPTPQQTKSSGIIQPRGPLHRSPHFAILITIKVPLKNWL